MRCDEMTGLRKQPLTYVRSLLLLCVAGLFYSVPVLAADAPDFPGWHGLWTREKDAGTAVIDTKEHRPDGGESPVIRIEHRGEKDWSLTRRKRFEVRAGDLFTMTAWVRITGEGRCNIGVVTRTETGDAVEWMYGADEAHSGRAWQQLRSQFLVPEGIHTIEPRLTGLGPATVWVQDFSCRKTGSLRELRGGTFPETCELASGALRITYHPLDGRIWVLDLRSGITYKQHNAGDVMGVRCEKKGNRIHAELMHVRTCLRFQILIELDAKRPEYSITLRGDGQLNSPLSFPHPFITADNTYLVIPMNEGISYPVTDTSIKSRRLITYGGHGICMAFWGATDGEDGYMAMIETPDDAAIRIHRVQKRLVVTPEWEAQKRRFGYARTLRYSFFTEGGHVAFCKRYREAMQKRGNLETLLEKKKRNPHVDLLVGAVNVWCWDKQSVALVRELQEAGIERILWSHRGTPETIQVMNGMKGVLTSRYDIYQDVMNPENFKYLRGVHSDWTTEAWPDDLMLDARGNWRRGWRVRCKDGVMRPCGVLCDLRAPAYAEKRIAEELKTHSYRCRFIDTTTASSWRECYHPSHPMTRTQSRRAKMQLLEKVSRRFNLVTGSETGHDAAVPYVHYFEGMLSLGPYRVPDAGRNMGQILSDVPERVSKFQVGHAYRLPLWELVYHDCVVAQWYWGDYNNKLPALWNKRDLLNVLYGTPPMFMFKRPYWRRHKERFVESYRLIAPVARAAGYSEMTDHRFLTKDRSVQQTGFANGVTVTVNFGDAPFTMKTGEVVKAMGALVKGID